MFLQFFWSSLVICCAEEEPNISLVKANLLNKKDVKIRYNTSHLITLSLGKSDKINCNDNIQRLFFSLYSFVNGTFEMRSHKVDDNIKQRLHKAALTVALINVFFKKTFVQIENEPPLACFY
jgi:hypothetical protein